MSSTLPFEICELIIDYLYDDKAALRKCSLVCKSWLLSARFHVFQTLELVSYGIEDALDFICAEGCTIPKYVRHLEITGEENNQAEELFNSALLRLPPLIDLENLALHSLPWATLDDGAKTRLSSMLSRTTSLGLYAAKVRAVPASSFSRSIIDRLQSVRLARRSSPNYCICSIIK